MFLFITLLTLLLSVVLALFNWRINKNALFVSLIFIIFSSYGVTHYFALYGKSPFWLAIFYTHFSPFWLLPGPFLYFYVRGTIQDQQGLSWKDSWHFTPALIHLINVTPYLFKPFADKVIIAETLIQNLNELKHINASWLYPTVFSFFMRTVLLTIYILYSAKMLWDFKPTKKEFEHIPFKQYQIIKRWLVVLHITMLIVSLSFFILTLNLSQSKVTSQLIDSMPIHYISGIAFLLMSSSLLMFPEILYGIPVYQQKKKEER